MPSFFAYIFTTVPNERLVCTTVHAQKAAAYRAAYDVNK